MKDALLREPWWFQICSITASDMHHITQRQCWCFAIWSDTGRAISSRIAKHQCNNGFIFILYLRWVCSWHEIQNYNTQWERGQSLPHLSMGSTISIATVEKLEIHSDWVILKNISLYHKISFQRFRFLYDRPDGMKIVIQHRRMYSRMS